MSIKKIRFCFSLLLLFPIFVFGGFGVKAGVNFNCMANTGLKDLGTLTAWRFGGIYAWQVSKKLSLQPEIFLSQTGTQCTMYLFGETVAVSEKYFYIEMPLMAAYTFFANRDLNMSVKAGSYGAYNLKAQQTVSGPDRDFGESIRNGISKFDLGLALGLELAKKMGQGNVVIDLRYQEGLVNINKLARYYPKMRNRFVALLLGYRFGR